MFVVGSDVVGSGLGYWQNVGMGRGMMVAVGAVVVVVVAVVGCCQELGWARVGIVLPV